MSVNGKSRREQAEDLLDVAWGIIANAHGGNWDLASPEWRGAAERWRDRWHEHLADHIMPEVVAQGHAPLDA